MTMPKIDPETIRTCYLKSLESTERFVSEISAVRWNSPTPCDEWSVKDVVNHLDYENLWAVELFNGKTIKEVGARFDGDLVGDLPRQR